MVKTVSSFVTLVYTLVRSENILSLMGNIGDLMGNKRGFGENNLGLWENI